VSRGYCHLPDLVRSSPWVRPFRRTTHRDEYILNISERGPAVPARAADRGGRMSRILSTGLRVREVDQAILREVRVQRDVHQAAETNCPYLGQTGDRRGIEHAFANYAQPSAALRYQHVAAGNKCESPGMIEPFRHNGDADVGLFGFEIPRTLAQRIDCGRATFSLALRFCLIWSRCSGGNSVLGMQNNVGAVNRHPSQHSDRQDRVHSHSE